MEDQNKDKPIQLGFLDCNIFENEVYRGGCLVTDKDTYPLEFRITSPIEPTSLQNILYGGSIVNYIYTELIAIPIIKMLTSDLKFVIVNKREFLEARLKVNKPIFYIDQKNNKLISHNKFPQEAKLADQVHDLFTINKLSEPFSRVKAALTEAHLKKIGE